jgi:hypothetical protein
MARGKGYYTTPVLPAQFQQLSNSHEYFSILLWGGYMLYKHFWL